jgi:TM2 domain-containing membrane protein YozV
MQQWNKLPPQLSQPSWLKIGFDVADWGGVLFLVALVLGGIGVHRLRNGKGGTALLRATMVISLVLAVAYVVAVWAMTGKPS